MRDDSNKIAAITATGIPDEHTATFFREHRDGGSSARANGGKFSVDANRESNIRNDGDLLRAYRAFINACY